MQLFLKFLALCLTNQRGEVGNTGLEKELPGGDDSTSNQDNQSESYDFNKDLGGIDPNLLNELGIETESEPKHVDGVPSEVNEGDESDNDNEGDDSNEGSGDNQPETFEIKHDGVVKNLTREQLLEHAQKGFDYTVKTMKLGEERKALELEKAESESNAEKLMATINEKKKELSELVNTKNKWDFYLGNLERSNPDLFDQVTSGFNEVESQFSNPLINSQMEAMNETVAALQKQVQDREQDIIRNQYNSDLVSSKEKWGETFKKVNLNFNEEAIKEAYINGAKTVNDAVIQVHGADMIKLLNSKNKVGETKAKVQGKKSAPTSGKSKAIAAKKVKSAPKGRASWNELERMVLKGDLD